MNFVPVLARTMQLSITPDFLPAFSPGEKENQPHAGGSLRFSGLPDAVMVCSRSSGMRASNQVNCIVPDSAGLCRTIRLKPDHPQLRL